MTDTPLTIEQKYQFTTVKDSVLSKDWASGSTKLMDFQEFVIRMESVPGKTPLSRVYNYTGAYETVRYAPTWWKIIDEPIVNALDHFIRCLGTSTPVTQLRVDFTETGRVRVFNDGPGIEIVVHAVASEKLGETVYVPTFLFGHYFQGSNRVHAPDSIIGGTNGIGVKLSNTFSTEFAVETVSGGKYFLQKWSDHMDVVSPPTIINDLSILPAERAIPHTLISFMPDYAGTFGYKELTPAIYSGLSDLVRTRVYYAAAYIEYTRAASKIIASDNTGNTPASKIAVSETAVWFNNERINAGVGIESIARILFPLAPRFHTIVKPTIDAKKKSKLHYKYPWEVCAVIAPSGKYDLGHLSIVNGIVVKSGKHVKYIIDEIIAGVHNVIAKIFNDKQLNFSNTFITNNLFILINCKIPLPSWDGQRKDVCELDIKKLSGYKLDPKFISQLSEKLKDQIVDNIFSKVKTANGKKKNKDSLYEKYIKARKAGGRQSLECGLIPVEGDSAMSQVCAGISAHVGFDKYGVISLGGVIMNARKQCVIISTKTGKFIKKTNALTNNLFMKVLVEVTGLNTDYSYEPNSPTYANEMSELYYGFMVACVDQDLDGKGNILSLLLSTFDLFWPNLLRAGYLRWFCTPIIRAFPKSGGQVLPFNSVYEYTEWEKARAIAGPLTATADNNQEHHTKANNVQSYDIQYYKGLGSHSRDETTHMFKSFLENIYTYYVDAQSRELFEIYFGKDPELRKIELSRPTKSMTAERTQSQLITKTISCSDHLEQEANLYQKDNLWRKLDHIIDGQNQSGRKILDGSIKALSGGTKMRVEQLSGPISENENYHHGAASLQSSITGKAFVSVGGKQLPFLVPLSNFGSRMGGGADAASPRYINTKLNKPLCELLFPAQDYGLLPFNFDEGMRGEPEYFVPIIPLAVTESTEIPAHGWKLRLWARDVFKVIENVRRLIYVADTAELLHMPPTRYAGAPYAWTGEFKTIRGELYSFGRYEYIRAKNTIIITELPLRVWTTPYVEWLKSKIAKENVIASVYAGGSTDLTVRIEVHLRPGAIETLEGDLCFTDGIEEYFQLRGKMNSNINLMNVDGSVYSADTYEEVIYPWFMMRKRYYGMRLERRRLQLVLMLRYYANVKNYIEQSNRLGLAKMRAVEQVKILVAGNFDKIYRARLLSPKFVPAGELEYVVLHGPKASYDYLLDISAKKTSVEAVEKLDIDVDKVIDEIAELDRIAGEGRFPGATIWLDELYKLEQVIVLGQKTFWRYADATKYKFE